MSATTSRCCHCMGSGCCHCNARGFFRTRLWSPKERQDAALRAKIFGVADQASRLLAPATAQEVAR